MKRKDSAGAIFTHVIIYNYAVNGHIISFLNTELI